MQDVFSRYRPEMLPLKRDSTQRKVRQYLKRLEYVCSSAPPGAIERYLGRRCDLNRNLCA